MSNADPLNPKKAFLGLFAPVVNQDGNGRVTDVVFRFHEAEPSVHFQEIDFSIFSPGSDLIASLSNYDLATQSREIAFSNLNAEPADVPTQAF